MNTITRIEKLEPVYDSAKSFYNKARVLFMSNGAKVLQSYDTHVAAITPDGDVTIYGVYSATTKRHINDFLYQNGFEPCGKREFASKYGVADTEYWYSGYDCLRNGFAW